MTKVLLKFMLLMWIGIAVQCIGISKADAGDCPSEGEIIDLIKAWGNRYDVKEDFQRYGDVDILQVGNNPVYCPVKAKIIVEFRSGTSGPSGYEWTPAIERTKRFKITKNDFGEWVITPL